jgi:hypothetical protein
MILKIPQQTFTQKEIRAWSLYESHLRFYPTITNYFEDIFKEWIITLDNPFALLWFRQLLDHKLDYLEKILTSLLKNSSELLDKIVNELPKKITYADKVIEKINSLSGEILSLHFLSKQYVLIEPLESTGDFLCDKKVTVSVKTKSDVNFNLEIIENYIYGLLYENEMKTLRDYNFHLNQVGGIDYNLRKAILVFLKENLIDYIYLLPEPRSEYDYNPLEKVYPESVKVKGYKYLLKGRKKIILEVISNNKRFELRLSKNKTRITSFTKSTDVYFPDNGIYDIQNIERSIDDWIDDFDRKAIDKTDFCGYINIPVTYMHERSIMKIKEELKTRLESRFINKNYKTTFCFYPNLTFEINEPIFLEFNG